MSLMGSQIFFFHFNEGKTNLLLLFGFTSFYCFPKHNKLASLSNLIVLCSTLKTFLFGNYTLYTVQYIN